MRLVLRMRPIPAIFEAWVTSGGAKKDSSDIARVIGSHCISELKRAHFPDGRFPIPNIVGNKSVSLDLAQF